VSEETSRRKANHLPGLIQPADYLETHWKHLTEFLCQVYATALIYDALRLAQAEIAKKVDVEPGLGITLEKSNGIRRKRRRRFTSYSKIPGAK
jgi:hypothetical protein